VDNRCLFCRLHSGS